MSDVQQQIADGARPRLARVDDRIEHGQDIPANVVAVTDRSDDTWRRNVSGTWDAFDGDEPYGRTYSGWPAKKLQSVFKTLTVVEVGPAEVQPAEPPLHAFVRGVDDCCDAWLATGSPLVTGKVQCRNLREAPFHFEPARCTNGPDCQRHPDADPEYTHEVDGTRMHHLGTGRMASDPAEDPRRELIRKVMAELGVEHPGDVLEALEKRFNALVLARRSRDENRRERLRAEAEVKRLSARLDEATEALSEMKPAESGTLTLTLPVVPDEAVALVGGTSGKRFVRQGEDIWGIEGGTTWRYRDVMFAEGSVTVEMAPPREPRTWPKLDDEPEIDDLPAKVDVLRDDKTGRRERWELEPMGPAGRRYRIQGGRVSLTLVELRTLGEVREVLT